MGRKKKEDSLSDEEPKKRKSRKKVVVHKEEKPIIYSKYQEDIFDFIRNGQGNLIIEAAAGSGKTFTLVKSVNLIDSSKRVLFVAFNKDIVKVLEKKVKDKDNVDVKTIHSLGYTMLQRNFPELKINIEVYKYKSHIMNNINHYSKKDLSSFKKREYYVYIDTIHRLVDLGRFYLSQTVKELNEVSSIYGLELCYDEAEIALEVMEWGKKNIDSIDYTDMVWLPNVLYLKPSGLQYDFIFADEAQDISKTQRELVLKCQKMGTRLCFFGDESQCIYGFGGADINSFHALRELPNTISLPLSISYRCPKNIVKFAQNIVPTIEYLDDGRDGEVTYNGKLEDIQDGDMVLCRNNAPLMKVYNDFIRMGKKCFIRGKDIGMNLKKMVENTKQDELNLDLNNDGVFVRLYSSLFDSRDLLMSRTGLDYDTAMSSALIINRLDMIQALEILSEGINNSEDLCERINSMFSDKVLDGISLSSIHKAKGLEADNIFIVCKSLMPSKTAKQDWEIQQEKNLAYVAYTRAKNKLCFVDENEFNAFNCDTSSIISSLKFIETKINKLLGKQSSHVVSDEIFAKEIIKRATTIEKPKSISKVLSTTMSGRKTVNSFETMFKKKK